MADQSLRWMSVTQRAELRATNTELLQLDRRISRLETVLRLLLDAARPAAQGMDIPTASRVEPRRRTC